MVLVLIRIERKVMRMSEVKQLIKRQSGIKTRSISCLVALSLLIVLGITGCNKYSGHGTATLIVQNYDSDEASVNFGWLDGSRVYNMEVKDSNEVLRYSGKLGKGTATVFYDNGVGKKELFKLHAGESIDSTFNSLEKGTFYIIIETDGECESGDFEFKLE